MGLPVDRLIVASNRNDILTRFFNSGEMEVGDVLPTTSPSMDIQVSSNLERLLFEVLGRDGSAVADLLTRFRGEGHVAVPAEVLSSLREEFDADRLEEPEVEATIARTHSTHGVLLDPHSAVGVGVAERFLAATRTPIVCLATADPAKFPDAVQAATGVRPPLPERLAGLLERPERVEHVKGELSSIEALVRRVLAVRR
jgi:threonine synthase